MKDLALKTADVPLTAATARTVLQLQAPANGSVEFPWLEFGTDNDDGTLPPMLIQVMRQTTAIGNTPTVLTPVELPNGDPGAPQGTYNAGTGSTTEPTYSDIYYEMYFPSVGRHIIARPPDKKWKIPAGERLGLVVTLGAGHSGNGKACIPVLTE